MNNFLKMNPILKKKKFIFYNIFFKGGNKHIPKVAKPITVLLCLEACLFRLHKFFYIYSYDHHVVIKKRKKNMTTMSFAWVSQSH